MSEWQMVFLLRGWLNSPPENTCPSRPDSRTMTPTGRRGAVLAPANAIGRPLTRPLFLNEVGSGLTANDSERQAKFPGFLHNATICHPVCADSREFDFLTIHDRYAMM
jgi:hypothetical protein